MLTPFQPRGGFVLEGYPSSNGEVFFHGFVEDFSSIFFFFRGVAFQSFFHRGTRFPGLHWREGSVPPGLECSARFFSARCFFRCSPHPPSPRPALTYHTRVTTPPSLTFPARPTELSGPSPHRHVPLSRARHARRIGISEGR